VVSVPGLPRTHARIHVHTARIHVVYGVGDIRDSQVLVKFVSGIGMPAGKPLDAGGARKPVDMLPQSMLKEFRLIQVACVRLIFYADTICALRGRIKPGRYEFRDTTGKRS